MEYVYLNTREREGRGADRVRERTADNNTKEKVAPLFRISASETHIFFAHKTDLFSHSLDL